MVLNGKHMGIFHLWHCLRHIWTSKWPQSKAGHVLTMLYIQKALSSICAFILCGVQKAVITGKCPACNGKTACCFSHTWSAHTHAHTQLLPALFWVRAHLICSYMLECMLSTEALTIQLLNKYSTYQPVKSFSGHSCMQSSLNSINIWAAAVTTGGQRRGRAVNHLFYFFYLLYFWQGCHGDATRGHTNKVDWVDGNAPCAQCRIPGGIRHRFWYDIPNEFWF